MVSIHAGNIMCSRLAEALWTYYLKWRDFKHAHAQIVTINRKDSTGSLGSKVRRRRSSPHSSDQKSSLPREDHEKNFAPNVINSQKLINISTITDSRHYV